MGINRNFVINNYNFRGISETKMKKKFLLWLCDYSYRIITYIFWIYFLFVIILDFFNINIGNVITYLFWLILGFYLGYTVALRVLKYLRETRNE